MLRPDNIVWGVLEESGFGGKGILQDLWRSMG